MTEDEAKTKWCPHTRALALASNNFPVSVNRVTDTSGTPDQSRCIGFWCMAWRWIDKTPRVGRRGYCGLAGKP